MPANKTPARLDSDKNAKPLTRILAHVESGELQGPGIAPLELVYEDQTGKRTSLTVDSTQVSEVVFTFEG